MKKFVALLLAVLMVASLCACGQKDTQTGSDIKTVTAGKLTMSTNAQFPPYESVADDGKGYEGTGFEGIDIEIAYALAQKLGLELVVDDMDFDSALSAVQTGKSDIVAAGVTVTPERQNTMCFTDSYANGVQVVIVKEGSDIKSIDDLTGKRIAAQIGTTGADKANSVKDAKVTLFNTNTESAMELTNGGVDAVINDSPVVGYYLAQGGSADAKTVGDVLEAEEYGIAVKKGNDKLAAEIDKALAELKKNGEYDKIYKTWFGEVKK